MRQLRGLRDCYGVHVVSIRLDLVLVKIAVLGSYGTVLLKSVAKAKKQEIL